MKPLDSDEMDAMDRERQQMQDVMRRFQLAYLLSLDQSHSLEIKGWNWQNPDWKNLKVRKYSNKIHSIMFTRLYYKNTAVGKFCDSDLKSVPFVHTSNWLRGAISLGKSYQKRLEARNK